MSRESLLSSLKGLSKNVYSREELLPEMDLLEEEMALYFQIMFVLNSLGLLVKIGLNNIWVI